MKEENRGHSFSFPAIIFPISLEWYWFFDYDYLNVVHFAYKESLKSTVSDLFNASELVFSDSDIKDIREDAE